MAEQVLAGRPALGGVRLVAVDGPSGAGKTTLAGNLLAELTDRGADALGIGTDEFATWDDPVSWWPRLRDGVLRPFARGHRGGYRRMDWTSGAPVPGELITVRVPEVLVLEGVSSGRASVRAHLTCLAWLDGLDQATRLERAVARDGETERKHLSGWQEFELGWFAADRTADAATIRIESSAVRPFVPVGPKFATHSHHL
ncbi:uridine kinase [Amycolatopsis albispora]|uniref:Uridine kinase n=1 Tax=Amycolatopsis albispora TaxID=1804986 RepID=A0A344LLB7_9PSEU|nr:uridine kinase [Amycolatopsis albispora]AXB48841.1 uridine kinase [Amycolatopsis albispora]